ncbi:MAG: RagB/SusD family nutrient uptake outer membrane protein, partial [Bacteroidia bacterium]|nr:RagB/SusD family nutrient uptake outer membrane protein [Bacteroidia bacterium]
GYNGWMGTAVTQNFVDMYEDSKGYPITDSRSNYDPNNPYINRDPRFNMTILYNNRSWYDRTMEFYVNGRDWGETYNNPFSYCIAKFWKESHQRYKNTTEYLNYVVFRYAETLLNYAEAQNELDGPTDAVRTATTELRSRVGQVPIPVDISNTKEAMRERIKNERAIEFCFEEQRWYDVLSWNEGVEYFDKTITAMRIKKVGSAFTYEVYDYEKRVFKSYMHRYPIPYAEIYKSQYLVQNEGW